MPTKFFGTVRPKSFDEKTWYHLFIQKKLFETRNFLKNSRIPFRNFSALWDIKISTENRDMPPLLSINFFRYQKFSGKQKGSFTKLFVLVLWDKKNRQNRDAPPPPSYGWKFSIKKNFWNTKVFSNEIFWYSETKTFRRKIVIPPPPLLSIENFSLPEIFWNTAQKSSLAKFFRPCEVKKIRQNREASPLLCSKIFDTRILSKHRSFEFYRQCETKIFQRSLAISPSHAQNFAIHEIFWNTELFPNEIFWYCVTKVFDGETWYPLSDT